MEKTFADKSLPENDPNTIVGTMPEHFNFFNHVALFRDNVQGELIAEVDGYFTAKELQEIITKMEAQNENTTTATKQTATTTTPYTEDQIAETKDSLYDEVIEDFTAVKNVVLTHAREGNIAVALTHFLEWFEARLRASR